MSIFINKSSILNLLFITVVRCGQQHDSPGPRIPLAASVRQFFPDVLSRRKRYMLADFAVSLRAQNQYNPQSRFQSLRSPEAVKHTSLLRLTDIRFSQNTISSRFHDRKSVLESLKEILEGLLLRAQAEVLENEHVLREVEQMYRPDLLEKIKKQKLAGRFFPEPGAAEPVEEAGPAEEVPDIYESICKIVQEHDDGDTASNQMISFEDLKQKVTEGIPSFANSKEHKKLWRAWCRNTEDWYKIQNSNTVTCYARYNCKTNQAASSEFQGGGDISNSCSDGATPEAPREKSRRRRDQDLDSDLDAALPFIASEKSSEKENDPLQAHTLEQPKSFRLSTEARRAVFVRLQNWLYELAATGVNDRFKDQKVNWWVSQTQSQLEWKLPSISSESAAAEGDNHSSEKNTKSDSKFTDYTGIPLMRIVAYDPDVMAPESADSAARPPAPPPVTVGSQPTAANLSYALMKEKIRRHVEKSYRSHHIRGGGGEASKFQSTVRPRSKPLDWLGF